MMQDEAMSMSNEQAIQILKPMRDMMRDQHGCPISDAYFAVDKAIHALQTISPDEVRGVGEWEDAKQHGLCRCSVCKDCYIEKDYITQAKWRYCPNCGARMKKADRLECAYYGDCEFRSIWHCDCLNCNYYNEGKPDDDDSAQP